MAVAGTMLIALGRALGRIQTLLRLQAPARPLRADETAMLRRVFGASVALDGVLLVEGRSGLFGAVNDRPFTLGNTIYAKRVDFAAKPWVLVHECAHVWQYQHVGVRYAAEALWAQLTVKPSAYQWEDELAIRGRTRWSECNREAQAQLLEDAFRHATVLYDDEPDRVWVRDGVDHTAFARDAIAFARRGGAGA